MSLENILQYVVKLIFGIESVMMIVVFLYMTLPEKIVPNEGDAFDPECQAKRKPFSPVNMFCLMLAVIEMIKMYLVLKSF